MKERPGKAWLDAAEAALAKNASSFATLPMAQIMEPSGLVATSRT